MELQLEDDTALVTASTSGLGLASARSLAAAGANVAICGRSTDRLADAREELLSVAGPERILTQQADITDPAAVEALVETTVETFGGLDHVVTSAGGVPSGSLLELDAETWYDAYEMLVMSHLRTVKAAHPYLEESDSGTITAITSTSVREPIDQLALSNGVRRAVIGIVKTAAREFAPNIRANAVLPGPHETPRIEELVEQALERGEYDSYQEGLDDWAAGIPLDRIGDPQELGDVVAFLASQRASFVTGTAIPVDGGRLRS